MKSIQSLVLLALVSPLCFTLLAGEPVAPPVAPQPPKRPFPALQNVLWYEDFENDKVSYFEGCKVVAENPFPGMKDNPCMEMGQSGDKNNKVMWVVMKPQQVGLKFPDTTNPTQISFFMNVWVEESGDIKLKCAHKGGDYEDRVTISKEKTWMPVNFRLSEMRNKQSHAEVGQVVERMEILYVPREKKEFKKAYVDDLLITTGIPKSDVMLPAVQKVRHEMVGMTKTPAKDGFSFTQNSQETLKAALKALPPKRKNKSVLTFGSRAEDGPELVKGLATAAGKVHLSGYTFSNAEIPETGSTAGMEDTRAFISTNLARTDAEFVLILLGSQDAKIAGRPADNVRLAIDRSLEQGAIPIVALPPAVTGLGEKEKKDLDSFVNTVMNICGSKGVSFIDTAVAIKSATNPMDGADLNAAGLDAVASLAATVIKHIDANVLNAKK